MAPTTKTKKSKPSSGSGRGDELVAVAARLFRDRGYDATSMQGIADEMGILKGSLYHYVGTKEDLLWMIVEPPLKELVEDAETIFAETGVPITTRLRNAIEKHCVAFEKHHSFMFVITRENGETISAGRRREFNALRDRYYELWHKAVTEGVKSGELRPDIDVGVTVQGIFGMTNWMFRWFKPNKRLSASEVAAQFGDMLVSGIGK